MPTTIPLYYYSQQVGLARVDPELGGLPTSLRAGVILPDTALKQHRGRPDVLLARLREQDDLLPRCHPFYSIAIGDETLLLRLSRIALRPALVPLLHTLLDSGNEYQQVLATIRSLASTVSRPVFLDSDRTNLTLANLRELSPQDVLSQVDRSVFPSSKDPS